MVNERDDVNVSAEVSRALTELRQSVVVPPVDPARAHRLMDAFDNHRGVRRAKAARWSWMSAAALVAVTVGLNWVVLSRGSHQRVIAPRAGSDVVDLTGFVAWPGADALPPFESGSMMRIELPVSALPALGLSAPLSSVYVVQADLVIAQDGLARAVRIVQ